MKRALIFLLSLWFVVPALTHDPDPDSMGVTMHLSYETEDDILSDFLSAAYIYRCVKPGEIPGSPLQQRKLELSEGKFGKALHIRDGWSVYRGTFNESGIDLDLITATIWGDWRTKPHYWGAGKFYGERGSVAFWVKASALNSPGSPDPDIVFMQGSIAWGRKERDLLRIDLDRDGKLSASIRDIFYQYHRIKSKEPVWTDDQWQHIVVVYDQSYGLKLYHNGKLIASNWEEDNWWQTPLPGLFSPFLPESYYDEIFFFDYPLNDSEIASLYSSNSLPPRKNRNSNPDGSEKARLLSGYGDLDNLDLPVLVTGGDMLSMKQTEIADCHDEKIPAWWVMDGRYELAWPHPYLLFTFILGDVDFHGKKLDIDLKAGEAANYISLEGVLDGVEVMSGKKIIDLNNYPYYFYSAKIDVKNPASLHFPLVKTYGTPPGLVDRGSLKLPLSGNIRIHEVQLWNVTTRKEACKADIDWRLSYQEDRSALDLRYADAFLKLKCPEERTLFVRSSAMGKGGQEPVIPVSADPEFVELAPLQPFHFFGPDLNPDMAIDKIGLNFYVIPETASDVLWVTLRDPANPSRIWARTVIRILFKEQGKPQKIALELDPVDIMLASDERLWVELKFAESERITAGNGKCPEINVVLSKDSKKSLSDYTFFEMIPARMQYMKEYNYQPWLFTGEQRNDDVNFWTNFGGPYDMWYPPGAVLRHDPDNEMAGIYKQLTGDRGYIYGGVFEKPSVQYDKPEISENIPRDAPSWAVWEREMYQKQLQSVHWIANMQRKDGFFWGGANDDVLIPLGYSAIPLMGDEISRKAFLRLYDGLEESGVFKDGYCDIWPIDYLHITDFICSRGLMVPYALGDPYVFEREMITARVYKDIMDRNNAERARKGLPPFAFNRASQNEEPKFWGEKRVQDYELTQVHWYWGKTPEPEPHHIINRNELAREMMQVAIKYDRTAAYEWTKAMRHTDMQSRAPGGQKLVTAALGGRLPGRIEAFPHAMVVSWDNPDPDIARLVYEADHETVKISLYNFKPEPQKLNMRLWRVLKGLYLLQVGKDLNDDGEIDAEKDILQERRIDLQRFSTLELDIPSKENIVVQLILIRQTDRPATFPDLAIHPVKDISQEGDELMVTVHNIGDGIARNVPVEVTGRDGSVLVKSVIPVMQAPVNLIPVTETVEFDLAGKQWHKIVIDRKNKIAEIFEENNEAVNPLEQNRTN